MLREQGRTDVSRLQIRPIFCCFWQKASATPTVYDAFHGQFKAASVEYATFSSEQTLGGQRLPVGLVL
jgi:hypothetical protein